VVLAETGSEAEARAILDRLTPQVIAADPSEVLRFGNLALLAEAAIAADTPAHAQPVYDALRAYAGRAVVLGVGVACWGSVDRILGSLATQIGDLDAAAAHLDAAHAFEAGMGARPWLAWTELARAELLARRGDPGDAEASAAARARAERTARELGMGRLLARSARLG
jgi:hypothetical protein